MPAPTRLLAAAVTAAACIGTQPLRSAAGRPGRRDLLADGPAHRQARRLELCGPAPAALRAGAGSGHGRRRPLPVPRRAGPAPKVDTVIEVEVVQLLVSPVHRFAGRPAHGPSDGPGGELVESVQVCGGLGLVGDRYFGRPAHRDAAVTLMAAEHLPLGINPSTDLRHTRRNVLLRGVDIDSYVGSTIVLDGVHGPVTFAVNRPARPCAWMDVTVGPGAQRALRGKGGVRCTPLSDGVLALGAATFRLVDRDAVPR